jgi:transposase-like protein
MVPNLMTMKKTTLKYANPIMAVTCSIIGHNYEVSNKITNHINEYQCKNCGKEVADNTQGYVEELTQKQREVNETLSSFFNKRHRRSARRLTA